MSKEFIFELDNALYNEETGEAVFKPKVKGELVRCRECKWWKPNAIGICKLHDIRPTPIIMDNWFCADGERRSE